MLFLIFLGNRALKSLYECDKCNERFCEMESHFSNYMAFYHILSRIGRGKKKPVYKNNSKSKIVVEENYTDIYLHPDDENLKVDKNIEEKTFTVYGVRSYIPIYVYKIFIKMALTIMPESEMKYCQFTNKWLMSEDIEIRDMRLSIRMYNCLEQFNGSCVIYKRNDGCKENMPCYLFGLKYNNFFIQTYIPLCYQDTIFSGKISMPLIPCTFDEEGIDYIRYLPDLSSHDKISKENISLKFDVGDWVL